MDALQDLEQITRMSEEQLDALPFGAIRLDMTGKILTYNMTESKLTGRDPKRVIGRNFFTDVAPCTNVQILSHDPAAPLAAVGRPHRADVLDPSQSTSGSLRRSWWTPRVNRRHRSQHLVAPLAASGCSPHSSG